MSEEAVKQTSPVRVQRSRKKGWRMPENTVYVGRGTQWGNPYKIGSPTIRAGREQFYAETPEQCVAAFSLSIRNTLSADYKAEAKKALRGKNLACWCPLDQRCHADVLLEIANG